MFDGIYLVGNPNCGKTTLFNLLTGKNEKVGNRAGVSVDGKTAKLKKAKGVTITDLPGTYSLKGTSDDERVVSAYLSDVPKAVINVIDGNNIERSLRLTAELTLLKVPMVVAINFCDELIKNGVMIDENALSMAFGVPFVKISARKNRGIDGLLAAVLQKTAVPRLVLPTERDAFIRKTVKSAVKERPKEETFTDKADRVLMHRFCGIPIFMLIITAVYFLTSAVGGYFGDKTEVLLVGLGERAKNALENSGAAEWFVSLIVSAIIRGVGEVLSFLPQIIVLFFMLSILEESGYSARAAFLLDGIMEKIGLGGKSLVAIGVSCGCAVNGIMTTRTVEDDKERRLTIMLAPFMPCGAKTAVFSWFAGLIFGNNPLITASLYFLSVVAVILFGALLKKLKRFNGGSALIMEIPVLRLPSLRGVVGALKEKTVDFILKAGSVIFLVSIVVWLLQNFGFNGYTTEVKDSFLFFIGDKLKYLFIPLGFGNWQSSVAVLASVFAKEAVVQTLTMVAENPAAVFGSAFSAYAFLTFILFLPPCVAALATAESELKSRKDFVFMIVFQFVAAYSVALTINVAGILISVLGWAYFALTIVGLGVIISVKNLTKKRGCGNCPACGRNKCRKKKASTTICGKRT
ncbi:MAG: ferrous iron transporter B [Clostridia bacterium]|nr:ferrous iron transporter B [Clostridia bacterium]